MSSAASQSLPATFQAAQYSKYGEKTVKLVELPVPVPKAGEMLVRVEAASINPGDWRLQTGGLKWVLPIKLPIVPGMDLSGVVAAVGEGVTTFAEADALVSNTSPQVQGALGQYAIVKANASAKRPSAVSPSDAAALPIAALTALVALRQMGVPFDGTWKDRRILILNAAGGVGTFAVQMAKLSGAHVVATCGARNLDLVKGLGADEVLDYKSDTVTKVDFPEASFDAICQAAHVTDQRKLVKALKATGVVAMIEMDVSSAFLALLNNINPWATKKMIIFILIAKDPADLSLAMEWIAQGKVKVVVDSTFPLSQVEEAWAKSSSGHAAGKVIVTMP